MACFVQADVGQRAWNLVWGCREHMLDNEMAGVLLWDVLLICLEKISVCDIYTSVVSFFGQVYPIRFHKEERQLPFPYQCNSCLAHILLLPGKSIFQFKSLWRYVVSNWCPPFNLTAAATAWLWLHVRCVWICLVDECNHVLVSVSIDMCS